MRNRIIFGSILILIIALIIIACYLFLGKNQQNINNGNTNNGNNVKQSTLENNFEINEDIEESDNVREFAIEMALEKLDIGYIDMMLLHHPGDGDVEAYKVMEKYVEEGKIRSIGLSNWYIEELEEFLPQVDIVPALVQNEIHPYYQEIDVVPYIQSKGIVVQGWYPCSSNPEHIKENTEIYHFELTDEEMKTIESLNRDEKHDWY